MENTTPRRRQPAKAGSHRPHYKKAARFPFGRLISGILTVAAIILCFSPTSDMLLAVAQGTGDTSADSSGGSANHAILDRYDMLITNSVSEALTDIVTIDKVYWLSDEDLIAPEPNPDCWGTTSDPSTLQWLLDEARDTLGVEDTIFSTDTEIMSGTSVTYYLDDTILVITWKQVVERCVYTMSEVKIAHPTQFRRFVADGVYGSDKQYYPSEMAVTVNAVTASSGDFYKFRSWGVNVYQRTVRNVKTWVDTCFIDDNGDFLFAWAGDFEDVETAQQYVDEHNVRFSLAFGPIMVVDGKNVVPDDYMLGEITKRYARMALCQVDELHYLLVAGNQEGGYKSMLTTSFFADQLIKLGVKHAYALDGGQTAAIITNDKLINVPTYGYQRQISDIIYFATAIPESNWKTAE